MKNGDRAMQIYIISGFLGAGKTTFIKEILKQNTGRKIAIIENEFGSESIDAKILNESDFYVTEISNGCICCTLKGDFVKAITEIEAKYTPDVLIIEPTGVSKLSEMFEMLNSENRMEEVVAITVIDVERATMYYENFGDFFKDQIVHADYLFLNRKADVQKYENVLQLLTDINAPGKILEHISIEPLGVNGKGKIINANDIEHNHHHHDHDATNFFQKLTFDLNKKLTSIAVKQLAEKITTADFNSIIRMKGIVNVDDKMMLIQYVANDFQIEPIEFSGKTSLTFIGDNLPETAIKKILLKDLI